MRYLPLIFVGLSLSIFTSHLRAQTQYEMDATSGAALDKADAKLNAVYQKVLSQRSNEKQFCTNLREAQRAWLIFVDLDLKTVFPLEEGQDPRVVYGSIYPVDYATTKAGLINERIKQLEDLIQ